MCPSNRSSVVLISGDAHSALATAIAEDLNLNLAKSEVATFADGETHVCIAADLRNATTVVVQPTSPPVNDRLIALGLLADAAVAAGAARVVAVVPYFGYSRQEQRSAVGEPRSARLAARFLGMAGVDHLVTLDLHAPALESALPMPVTHLQPDDLFLSVIRDWEAPDLTIVAPDAGGLKRAQRIAGKLGAKLAVVTKTRPARDVAAPSTLLGDARGQECVIIDDMASTGRTLASAAEVLQDAGAQSVHALFTHPVMTEGALEKLLAAPIQRLVTTNSIPTPDHPQLQIVSTASLLAEAVRCVIGQSV
jgi:ribose-phosphate pyrophosphokinase